MKRPILFALTLMLSAASFGAADTDGAVRLLLARRSSVDARKYAAAVERVMEGARNGMLVPQFVAAVLSESSDWPASARLTPECRKAYLDRSRPYLQTVAERENNALAWYLLYLDSHDETCLEKAADGGNPHALNQLGTRRLTVVLQDPGADPEERREILRTSFSSFRRAADQGDANGLNNLGICLQNGWGCVRDEAKAFDCFSRAAQKGHTEAINNLGRFYREGVYVEQNLKRALRCFRMAAEQGDVSGKINYLLAMIRGEGMPADVPQGIRLLERMASRGQVEAMDCLSECYSTGLGTLEPNAAKSVLWMMRSRAAQGDANAAEWLKENHESTDDR